MFSRNSIFPKIAISSWALRAAGLLSPSQMNCPVCGKSYRFVYDRLPVLPPGLPASFAASVCPDCLDSIPWITNIQCAVCGRPIHCDDCRRRHNGYLIRSRSAVRYDNPMKKLLALYKYRGKESLLPYLADMLSPAFEALTAELVPLASRARAKATPLTPRSSTTFPESSARERASSFFASLPALRSILHKSPPAPVWDLFTFVPVSGERLEERGFNQAERLAAALGARYRTPVVPLLERARHTAKQSFKTRAERLRDTSTLFRALPAAPSLLQHWGRPSSFSPRRICRPLRILIVDDIYTTGGTLQDCARALEEAAPGELELYALTWARS